MYLDVLWMQAQCKYYEDVYMYNKGWSKQNVWTKTSDNRLVHSETMSCPGCVLDHYARPYQRLDLKAISKVGDTYM